MIPTINPERNDDTLRVSALANIVGKFRDSRVVLVDATGKSLNIVEAQFFDGKLHLFAEGKRHIPTLEL
jgi:hypothetical protein